jgi:large subunit ribosomal protein L31e
MLSKTQPDSEDVVAEEEEPSATLQEESKETVEETEEEADEGQPSVEKEVPARKAEKEEEEAEEEEEKEEIEIVEERICTIPFRKVWATPMGKRTPRASRVLRAFVKRHMKAENVEISNEVNEELWARGIRKPPRKITVRLVKDKEGRVIVYPATTA